MTKKARFAGLIVLLTAFIGLLIWYLSTHSLGALHPRGQIATKERSLMIYAAVLAILIVLPVYIMTLVIAVKYREGNTRSKYAPEWDHNLGLETAWWLFPTIIILILSIITWRSSHELDPFKKLNSTVQPITIQAVALQWKWLFIYPEQGVATINYVQFPAGTPINFQITADAPMNSLWIPQLGGQMYAMNGMSTQLHLIADQEGSYRGSSANISGQGFANMKFIAKASSNQEFSNWLAETKHSPQSMSQDIYNNLAKPSSIVPIKSYTLTETNLFNNILLKYSAPNGTYALSGGGASL